MTFLDLKRHSRFWTPKSPLNFVIAGLVPATHQRERRQDLAQASQHLFQRFEFMGRRDKPGGDEESAIYVRSGLAAPGGLSPYPRAGDPAVAWALEARNRAFMAWTQPTKLSFSAVARVKSVLVNWAPFRPDRATRRASGERAWAI